MSVMFFLKSRGGVLRVAVLGCAAVATGLCSLQNSYASYECEDGITCVDCSSTIYINEAGGGDFVGYSGFVYTTDSATSPCFALQDGYDADLNGAEIRCTRTNGNCATAVEGDSVGSVLEEGSITGPFTVCADNVFEVKGVLMDGCATGVAGSSGLVKKVWRNIIKNGGATGIDVALVNNTAFIRSNLVDGYPVAIEVSGTSSGKGPKVWRNVLVRYGTGIRAQDSSKLRVLNNIICEGNVSSTSIDVTVTNKTFTDNYCCSEDQNECAAATPFEND